MAPYFVLSQTLRTLDELFRSPASQDLTFISGELHFLDGDHEARIVTAAKDDSVEEKDEVFVVQLLCAAGGNPGPTRDTRSIRPPRPIRAIRSNRPFGSIGSIRPIRPTRIEESFDRCDLSINSTPF